MTYCIIVWNIILVLTYSIPVPANIFTNTRIRSEMCSKLTIKAPQWHWHRYGISIVNVEQILNVFLVYPLLTLDMQLFTGMPHFIFILYFFVLQYSLWNDGGNYWNKWKRRWSECETDIKHFFFYLGFLSRTLTIHRTAGEGEGLFFNSSLPLPPALQTMSISRAITAEILPLHIASSRARTGTFGFRAQVANH